MSTYVRPGSRPQSSGSLGWVGVCSAVLVANLATLFLVACFFGWMFGKAMDKVAPQWREPAPVGKVK